MSHGYGSGMQTDTESARLSNVQPYKFNQQNRNGKVLNIRKINPSNGPASRGSGAGMGTGLKAKKSDFATHNGNTSQTIDAAASPDNYLSGGGQSRMSGASLGSVLPDL